MATEKDCVETGQSDSSPLELASENHLLPQHVEDLARSGITEQQALAEGIRSLVDPEAIASILNWERPAKALGPCLLFAFRGADGQLLSDYARVKPDKPRTEKKGEKKGKEIKYESPVGRPNRVYFPSGTTAALGDVSVPLVISEGEKKALKATLSGFPCIGLVGVWGWQQKREKDADGRGTGERKLIPDLDAITWEGRLVYLIFDSDAARKQEVQFAETAFAEVLLQRGAKVVVVRLPESTGLDSQPDKVGLDDYLVAHPSEDLRALIDAAAPFVRAVPTTEGSPLGRTLVDGWELTESGYSAYVGRTFHCVVESDEDGVPHITKKMKLSNFAARISGETILDDGAERHRELEITVEWYGRVPATTTIPVERFSTLDWVVERLGPQHVIQPGNGKRDHLRCAVQELSGQDIKSAVVYGHTGFREIDDQWCYLHGDGAIGPVGVVPGVKVQLEGNAALYRLPAPPSGAELVNSVRASLGILNGLAPDAVVFPLVASTYRAPLGAPDFSPWYSGFTGQGKSELLALGQQHYGPEMTRLRLPGNWTSTDNALEGMAFTVKDALFVVDDFCPAGAKHDHERMHRVADRWSRRSTRSTPSASRRRRTSRARPRRAGPVCPPSTTTAASPAATWTGRRCGACSPTSRPATSTA